MPAIHDRGGWPGAGPIDRGEHELAHWEKQTEALVLLLTHPNKRVFRVDELRRAIESLEPESYERLDYFERWLGVIENLLVEKGVLTHEEVAERAMSREP